MFDVEVFATAHHLREEMKEAEKNKAKTAHKTSDFASEAEIMSILKQAKA